MLTEDERFDTRDALESCDICQLRFPTEDLDNHICPDCWAELEQTEYQEYYQEFPDDFEEDCFA
jgi:uncharacterized Zn ribbon protein